MVHVPYTSIELFPEREKITLICINWKALAAGVSVSIGLRWINDTVPQAKPNPFIIGHALVQCWVRISKQPNPLGARFWCLTCITAWSLRILLYEMKYTSDYILILVPTISDRSES